MMVPIARRLSCRPAGSLPRQRGRSRVPELDWAGICWQNFDAPVLSKDALTLQMEDAMKKIFLAAVIATFAAGSAFAQETCDTKAMSKDGKPLAGAAKTSFVNKCKTDACAGKAMSADGKPLAGAAKSSFMKKCEKDA
jgi:hypothetical protein